ncbi:MAG TPA: hypothetical protein VMG98_02485 [Verrucomicrobiae bacterium]|nr:hypothetical protein [Verrucomicrobiae bacterium]
MRLVAFLCLVIAIAAAPTPLPTPAPVALQYDQITRMIAAPATPPPPGTFADDYQAALLATPNPLLARISAYAAAAGGNHAFNGAMSATMGMMTTLLSGRPTRYTIYFTKGWIRTDDTVAQTATISKCDQHTIITLDLARKTYTQKSTESTDSPCVANSSSPSPAPERSPGTADLTTVSKVSDLGPLTIDGIDTTGTSLNMTMTTTNATGSCHDGSMAVTMVMYISKIGQPRAFCPLPENPLNPGNLYYMASHAMASHAGCRPTMHMTADASAATAFNPTNFQMYTLIDIQLPSAAKRSANMLTERGHVAWLDQAQADALFIIPPDFTAAK